MTDLEGSTAHLRALGDDYGAVLAQHHAVIRAAFEAEDGVEVGSEGDSFAVVLPRAAAAIRAAVAVQRGLLEIDWPDSPWRVRVAIHAGVVEMAEAGAVGVSLHEASRIRAVVHGGQIVVSEVARRAIDEPVPVEIGVTDLGLHTVRDFAAPIRLHQVGAPGLPADFPPLRTMATRGVPQARTPFIGRMTELDELLDVLASARLVTVTGPGGSGKTRLTYEVARRAEFEAVTVVELAGLRDSTQVDAEVAMVVGARQPDEIASSIGARELLLVMDNCEHLMPRVALLASELLQTCEGLVVLATSREPLSVAGEVVWHVPQLRPDDAIGLFRARAARTTDDEQLVRSACERLGGMPLAIELAAARVRSVPLEELVHRLDDQLRVLTTGVRDVPRQQTLRATLDWSHNLLTTDERTVFRRLAVFAGGFTLDAAETVAARGSDVDVFDALDGLVRKSLVELSPDTDRYRMLEPVRQYALDQLHAADEDHALYERHATWASTAAAEANRHLFTAQQRHWTAVLDAERDNFGAAIGWALDNHRAPVATAIAASLAWYWFTSARNDGFVWTPRLVDELDSLDTRDRAKALLAAGIAYCDFVKDKRAIDWLVEAEGIFRQLGHERGLGSVLFWLGRGASGRDDLDLAERVFIESLALHDRLGDLFGWGWSKTNLGNIARKRGDLDRCEEMQHEVLARCDRIPQVVGAAYGGLSHVAGLRGEIELAMAYNALALDIYRDLDDRWQVAIVLASRGWLTVGVSLDTSAACVLGALRGFQEVGSDPDTRPTLLCAAGLLQQAGRSEEAAVLAGGVQDIVAQDSGLWPKPARTMVASLRAMVAQPTAAIPLERGRRLGVRNAADAAIEWLQRAYPTSASISL